MSIKSKRLITPTIMLHVMKNTFRESHLLPFGVRHSNDLLPQQIRIIPLYNINKLDELNRFPLPNKMMA
ncbi:MAG: hypothetical protein K8R11_02175 [Methanococcoides sp.]|nr:hypothetical protein [Methanococcoides sp.]